MKCDDYSQIRNFLKNKKIPEEHVDILEIIISNQSFWEEIINDAELMDKILQIRPFIFKNLLSGILDLSYIYFSNLLLNKILVLPYDNKSEDIKKFLNLKINSITRLDQTNIKMNLILCRYVADSLSGDLVNAKSRLFKDLVKLNINFLAQNQNQKTLYENIIASIFKVEEVIKYFKEDIFSSAFWKIDQIEKRSALLWTAPFFFHLYSFENIFKTLYENFLKLYYEAMERFDIESSFLLNYFISHIYLNLSSNQKDFRELNNQVRKPFSNFIKKKLIPYSGINNKYISEKIIDFSKPLKIGFVLERCVDNSPIRLIISLIEKLKETDSKNLFYIYDLEVIEKSYSDPKTIQKFQSIGAIYKNINYYLKDFHIKRYYYSHYEKAILLRNKIVSDEIDIIISIDGTSFTTFLLATRSAPLQIYWCHGDFEIDFDGIDKRITHVGLELKKNQLSYKQFNLSVFDTKNSYDLTAKDLEFIKTKRDIFRGKIVFGNIGRIVKLESEIFIKNLSIILKKYPDSVFLACGGRKTDYLHKLLEKYDILDRVMFPGFVKTEVYSHIIDIFLDTYPLVSGNAIQEYILSKKKALYVKISDPIIFNCKEPEISIIFEKYFQMNASFEADFIIYPKDKVNETIKDIKTKYTDKILLGIYSENLSDNLKMILMDKKISSKAVYLLHDNNKAIENLFKEYQLCFEILRDKSINLLQRISDIFIIDSDISILLKHNRVVDISGLYNLLFIKTEKYFFESLFNQDEFYLSKIFKKRFHKKGIDELIKEVFRNIVTPDFISDIIKSEKVIDSTISIIREIVLNEKFRKTLFYYIKRSYIVNSQYREDNFYYYTNRRHVNKKISKITLKELI